MEHRKYGSKYAALRVDAQGADPILHPHTGAVIGHKKPLVAEFGILGEEFVARDEKGDPLNYDQYGQPMVSAAIRGFYWDSETAQRTNGWTDEETDSVIQLVEYFCRTQPDVVWRLEDAKFTAPWPTYDQQTDKNRVAFAIEGGFVEQALAYAEQEGHEKVVAELRAHLDEQRAEAEAEQALTAV